MQLEFRLIIPYRYLYMSSSVSHLFIAGSLGSTNQLPSQSFNRLGELFCLRSLAAPSPLLNSAGQQCTSTWDVSICRRTIHVHLL